MHVLFANFITSITMLTTIDTFGNFWMVKYLNGESLTSSKFSISQVFNRVFKVDIQLFRLFIDVQFVKAVTSMYR